MKIYNMSPKERKELGKAGRRHVEKNYSFSDYKSKWIDLLDRVHEEHGSWKDRKKYEPWKLLKIN